MRTLLILGAGTAGTMLANRMATRLDDLDWRIIVVDRDVHHCYQPGLLFLPFDLVRAESLIKPKRQFMAHNIEVIFSDIERIDLDNRAVYLPQVERVIHYDGLVIATGSQINPEAVPGLKASGAWYKNIFDFYTLPGAKNLSHFLSMWQGGRLVVNLADAPVKYPPAALEFLMLADWFFRQRRMRDEVDLILTTPADAVFSKPLAAAVIRDLLSSKGIRVIPNFALKEVDTELRQIWSRDGKYAAYDLLVTVPPHIGVNFPGAEALVDQHGFVKVDPLTLQSTVDEYIWAAGDVAALPSEKMGAVAHSMLDTLTHNIERRTWGLPPQPTFDGHTTCFIETGFDKAVMVDFDNQTETPPGGYPVPGVGPFHLLEATSGNHRGKLAMEWVYWNLILRDRPLPAGSKFSLIGKSKTPVVAQPVG